MKKKLLVFLIFSLALPVSVFCQQFNIPNTSKDPAVQLQKLSQFYRYLNGTYVDTINTSALVESAIVEMLAQLDPHSAYIPAEDMKEVQESFDGSFSGIGIEFNILNDTLFVVNTISGGPSQKVGLIANDRIVEVDGKSVIGIKQNGVAKVLRGAKGTKVELKVMRRGENEPLNFLIVRDNIPINTIDAAYKINPHTGYIKVNRFANTTMTEFKEAFDKMGGIDALIVDLRGNGGGILEQAIQMSNFFLPEGSIIVSTEGRQVPSMRYMAEQDGRFKKGKVVVLIDESSASASEIVAGALQDWDRAVIVGRRSFGKGLVQRQLPLLDNSSVRITVARYHTPTGRAIQRPFVNGHKDEYYASLEKRFAQGGIDTLERVDSLRYKTLKLGRSVYGGAGIYPDVYIPIDTTGYSQYWVKLVRKGVIMEFVNEYMDTNRAVLDTKYPTFDKFETTFNITPQIVDDLTALGAKRDVPVEQEGLKVSESRMKLQLKALIAQRLWGMNEYYRVINQDDDGTLKKAEEILSTWNESSKGIVAP